MASPYTLVGRADSGPLGSTARGGAELANAAAALLLSNIKTSGGLATATTTSKVKFANTLAYSVGGVWYSQTTQDNFWTLGGTNTSTAVAAASWQKYILCIDNAQAAVAFEGTQSTLSAAGVKWTNIAAQSSWAALLAVLNTSPGLCVAGVLTVATDATHTFTPGTTLLGAAGITATYVDGIDSSLLPLIATSSGINGDLIYGQGG